jgi:hypothetical protein
VVGHDVDDDADAERVSGVGEPPERLRATEVGRQVVVVDDVIAVLGARLRLQDGGQLGVGDAEVA